MQTAGPFSVNSFHWRIGPFITAALVLSAVSNHLFLIIYFHIIFPAPPAVLRSASCGSSHSV